MTSGSAFTRDQALDAATRKLAQLIAALVAILAGVPLLWLALNAYVAGVSLAADGVVTGKREAILLGGGDGWLRVLEVAYRYRPADAALPEEASHNVDVATYDRLRIGQPVRIHYTPSPLLRHWAGVGSFIDGTSSFARTRYGATSARDLAIPAAMVGAIGLGLRALRTRSVAVGVAAALVGGAAAPSALLFATACLIAPGLFWAWRRRGRSYGWMLVGAILTTMGILYWRVPHPDPWPPGSRQASTAIVRQSKVVNQIWRGPDVGPSREGGESIGHPFQVLDLEFTPIGGSEPVHAVDRIDAASVPAITAGARVSVTYSTANPRAARMVGATRTYDRAAWLYLTTLASAFALVITFVAVPIADRIKRFTDRLSFRSTDVISRQP